MFLLDPPPYETDAHTAVRRVRGWSGDDKGADRGRVLVERGSAAVPRVTQALVSER